MSTSIELAKKTIERAKALRPTCDNCMSIAYMHAYGAWLFAQHANGIVPKVLDYAPMRAFMEVAGYEQSAEHAGYVKRCDACRNTFRYPWAAALDPVAVAAFIDANYDRTFPLDELKSTFACIFCTGRGVHECPGGECTCESKSGDVFSLAPTRVWFGPGQLDASEFYMGTKYTSLGQHGPNSVMQSDGIERRVGSSDITFRDPSPEWKIEGIAPDPLLVAQRLKPCTEAFDFPVMRGLAPNQEHVYCDDCGELLTVRHQCKSPKGGFKLL